MTSNQDSSTQVYDPVEWFMVNIKEKIYPNGELIVEKDKINALLGSLRSMARSLYSMGKCDGASLMRLKVEVGLTEGKRILEGESLSHADGKN